MDNNDILMESFFGFGKKKSFIEKLRSSLPEYNPIDPKTRKAPGDAYPVSDIDELKKRLTGAFGALFGTNTIKSMTSKSVKKFPIIISENVDPNTAVLIKRNLEDQVAEYMNLLISNQVFDLGEFKTDESDVEGNIATRALEGIGGIDFSREGIANKALRGKLSTEDVFGGSPIFTLYNSIRENYDVKFDSGNKVMDTLMENAIIVPADQVNELKEFILENYELQEEDTGNFEYEESRLDFGRYTRINPTWIPNTKEKIQEFRDLAKEFYEKFNKFSKRKRTPEEEKIYKRLKRNLIDGDSDLFQTMRIANNGRKSYEDMFRYVIEPDLKRYAVLTPDNFQDEESISSTDKKVFIDIFFGYIGLKRGIATLDRLEEENQAMTDLGSDTLEKITSKKQDSYYNRTGKGSDTLALLPSQFRSDEGRKELEKQLDINTASMLERPENAPVKDKYSKAVFLLQTRRISGKEFVSYCVLRLGIPIPKQSYTYLIQNYKIGDIMDYSMGGTITAKKKHYYRNDAAPETIADAIADKWSKSRRNFFNKFKAKTLPEAIAKSIDIKEYERWNKSILETNYFKSVAQTFMSKHAGAFLGSGLTITAANVGAFTITGALGAISSGVLLGASIIGLLGAAGIGAGIYGFMKRKKDARAEALITNLSKNSGWERVERLILSLDRNQQDVIRVYGDNIPDSLSGVANISGLNPVSSIEDLKAQDEKLAQDKSERDKLNDILDGFLKNMDKTITEESKKKPVESEPVEYKELMKNQVELQKLVKRLSRKVDGLAESEEIDLSDLDEIQEDLTEETNALISEYEKDLESLIQEMMEDKEAKAELLSEATVSLLKPTIVRKISYDPEDVLLAPQGYARSRFVYGSTEYDRRDNKDRRFNAPLIMTVKFRERFSDGTFSDNELVAVIGILGVITRVPSEEMRYVLEANAQGASIEGIFKSDDSIKGMVSDLLAGTKIKKDLENLPQSGEVWKNLEKVASLAVANKLAGKGTSNITNAHIIFSQKEIDEVKAEDGVDYIRNSKLSAQLMKKYSAMSLMVANDAGERLYIFDDLDSTSWNVAPYSALQSSGNSGDQLVAALSRIDRSRLG